MKYMQNLLPIHFNVCNHKSKLHLASLYSIHACVTSVLSIFGMKLESEKNAPQIIRKRSKQDRYVLQDAPFQCLYHVNFKCCFKFLLQYCNSRASCNCSSCWRFYIRFCKLRLRSSTIHYIQAASVAFFIYFLVDFNT